MRRSQDETFRADDDATRGAAVAFDGHERLKRACVVLHHPCLHRHQVPESGLLRRSRQGDKKEQRQHGRDDAAFERHGWSELNVNATPFQRSVCTGTGATSGFISQSTATGNSTHHRVHHR